MENMQNMNNHPYRTYITAPFSHYFFVLKYYFFYYYYITIEIKMIRNLSYTSWWQRLGCFLWKQAGVSRENQPVDNKHFMSFFFK